MKTSALHRLRIGRIGCILKTYWSEYMEWSARAQGGCGIAQVEVQVGLQKVVDKAEAVELGEVVHTAEVVGIVLKLPKHDPT